MSDKNRKLQHTLWQLQRRWGEQAINAADVLSRRAEIVIPTGFPALDTALQNGGITLSRLTEVVGRPTSGMTTLAHKLLANAQAQEATVAYLDLAGTFDPDYAARVGVRLDHLLILEPDNTAQALAVARDLLQEGNLRLIVLDLVDTRPDFDGLSSLTAAVRRLHDALVKSSCAALLLRPANVHPAWQALTPHVYTRLEVERQRWLNVRRDVNGYQANINIVKDKGHPLTRRVVIEITFDGVIRGDGT